MTNESFSYPLPVAKERNVWIFQANPKNFDIIGALADPEYAVMHWRVTRHVKKIKKGDLALIWKSTKEAGIYAIYEIVSDPGWLAEAEYERKYWTTEGINKEKEKKFKRVEIKCINLLQKPIYKDDIQKLIPDLSIIADARGTNFSISELEWGIIKKLIEGRKP